jgi:hypothetical protein
MDGNSSPATSVAHRPRCSHSGRRQFSHNYLRSSGQPVAQVRLSRLKVLVCTTTTDTDSTAPTCLSSIVCRRSGACNQFASFVVLIPASRRCPEVISQFTRWGSPGGITAYETAALSPASVVLQISSEFVRVKLRQCSKVHLPP